MRAQNPALCDEVFALEKLALIHAAYRINMVPTTESFMPDEYFDSTGNRAGKDCPSCYQCFALHFRSPISTTPLLVAPRARASCMLSGDTAKAVIRWLLKVVNGFASHPDCTSFSNRKFAVLSENTVDREFPEHL
jgi:hypothetical protein